MTAATPIRPSPKPFLRAFRTPGVMPPPIWLMRQAGRYLPEYRALREKAAGFLDLCYRPEYAAEATLQPLRRFSLDAAILFADLPLLADGLGQKLDYREGEGPVLEPIRRGADLKRLRLENIHRRLAPVYETVARVKAALPAEVALIGFSGAPWTLAAYMVQGRSGAEFAAAKRWAFSGDPDFDALIALLVEATVEYLDGQIKAGAEAVQLFDSWAGLLPAPAFARWCVRPVAEIVAKLRARHPDLPIIAFPRNAGFMIETYAEQTGVDCVGLDYTVPLVQAAALQAKSAVQGNLDPQYLVLGGTAMESAAVEILERLAKGRFIFNLGHGVVPETPVENVARLVEIVRGWRQ